MRPKTKAEKLVFIYQNMRMIRRLTGNERWCPLLNHVDDGETADTDEYELTDLAAWWNEYVQTAEDEIDLTLE